MSYFSLSLLSVFPLPLHLSRDRASLPHGVELLGGVLSFRGPMALCYAGLYECRASFYKHTASVQLDVSVKPGIQAPSKYRLIDYCDNTC